AFDLTLAVPGFLIALPVILIAGLLIRLETPGPALFRQVRVGRGGTRFTVYKLRSMTSGTVQAPTHEVGTATITRLGSLMRRAKVDELPQLYNVMRGDMSLVGPRPCLPSQDDLIAARTARGVDTARPGITGLAQVNGIDMSAPVALAEVDARYVRDQSLGLDIALLAATVGLRHPAVRLDRPTAPSRDG
ncbi:MAG: sugar transferase, partial [Pseudomonadota bacterium]